MLSVFVPGPNGLTLAPQTQPEFPANAIWFDLLDPTKTEETQVEQALGVAVPTRDEMREIEASNRLFEENGSLYLTATVVTKLDTPQPENGQVTFILTGTRLVTNRYADLLPFRRFIDFAATRPALCTGPALLLNGLLEALVNRIADVLEMVGSHAESVSARVFAQDVRRARDFRAELAQVGRDGELVSKARESLVSLARMVGYVQQSSNANVTPEARSGLRIVSRDIQALSDHATFLGDKVQFLLDATLGMVTIDQNNILKIFSVVTVLLLPPSVIGAFFGMNFVYVPLLKESWGVWAAVAMMVVTAVVPYAYFKRRGWL